MSEQTAEAVGTIIGLYAPPVLLALTILFFIPAFLKKSSKLMMTSYIFFFPIFIGLMIFEVNPIYYLLLAVPPLQIFLFFKYRQKRKQPTLN